MTDYAGLIERLNELATSQDNVLSVRKTAGEAADALAHLTEPKTPPPISVKNPQGWKFAQPGPSPEPATAGSDWPEKYALERARRELADTRLRAAERERDEATEGAEEHRQLLTELMALRQKYYAESDLGIVEWLDEQLFVFSKLRAQVAVVDIAIQVAKDRIQRALASLRMQEQA